MTYCVDYTNITHSRTISEIPFRDLGIIRSLDLINLSVVDGRACSVLDLAIGAGWCQPLGCDADAATRWHIVLLLYRPGPLRLQSRYDLLSESTTTPGFVPNQLILDLGRQLDGEVPTPAIHVPCHIGLYSVIKLYISIYTCNDRPRGRCVPATFLNFPAGNPIPVTALQSIQIMLNVHHIILTRTNYEIKRDHPHRSLRNPPPSGGRPALPRHPRPARTACPADQNRHPSGATAATAAAPAPTSPANATQAGRAAPAQAGRRRAQTTEAAQAGQASDQEQMNSSVPVRLTDPQIA